MQNEILSIRQGVTRVSHHNQEELRSVCQGQEETVRMVWGSQMESTQSTCKGKKPIYTFTKKGNENQSVFSDQVVEPVALAVSRIKRVEVTEKRGLKL